MSYILDALRRAEAERERGNVPGLHTQARPVPSIDDEDERRADARRGVPRVAWIAGGLVLAAIAVVVWRPWSGATVSATAPGGVVGATAPADATPAQPAPSAVAAAVPVQAPLPPAAAARPAPPATLPPRPAPAHVEPTPPRAAQAPRPAPPVATPAAAGPMPLRLDPRAAAPAREPGRPASAAAPERILRIAELPDALRRELPQLAFGGSIHSPDPFSRMVIINGQVRREGETVAPGLTLTRIRASSAVFEYKGQLFETSF